MRAARGALGASPLRLLAVTVMTSYDDADLAAAGYDFTVPELVAERAAQARDIGVDGLVCSAEEAANLRGIVSAGMVIGLIDDIPSCEELIERIAGECRERLAAASALAGA